MKKVLIIIISFIIIGAVLYFILISNSFDLQQENSEEIILDDSTMQITSSAFKNEGAIPGKYTCDGDDENPPLSFTNIPNKTQSLVLVVEDPDAPVGTWTHWLVWNIDPLITQIQRNAVPENSVQGYNSWERNDYGGPCPPSGTHRYFFKLYALDTKLDLAPSADKAALEQEIEGHILAKSELIGTYSRE